MIHIFINALAASAGGGLTYIRNVVPRLATRGDVRATVLLSAGLRDELTESDQVRLLRAESPSSAAARFWYEQIEVPRMIRNSGAEVLLSTGNFAVFRSPVPQILLSRNALYTSSDFLRDLRDRGEYRMWLDTLIKGELARWSVGAATCTVAPSAAFARDLQHWTGCPVIAIHHGFSPDTFFARNSPLRPSAQSQLAAAQGALRLLFVSHYNYYRNFETLLRALAILKQRIRGRGVRLILTSSLTAEENHSGYNSRSAAALIQELGLREEVVELGAVPYSQLHHLYRACDLYVTPAYAETFAHPLVEAMASGLPVIASDLPVHREICRDAALYFFRFSAEELAERILKAASATDQLQSMKEKGLLRARDFNWDRHIDDLLQLASRIAAST
ncbi:MAG TPA: glycosyltransferase family 1 protein [Candidatus Binatia bacterium]|nr:glycosyltransferase family 1 protein [Candidatus Binatia bacterium]